MRVRVRYWWNALVRMCIFPLLAIEKTYVSIFCSINVYLRAIGCQQEHCRSKGPSNMNLHFKMFDRRNTAPEELSKLWKLAKIMRRHVFVRELEVAEEKEFDDHDGFSRHIISFIGDAPISYARWRVVEETGSTFALIERWCPLHRHRNLTFAKQLLRATIRDISSVRSTLSAIVTTCPNQPVPLRVVESIGFKQIGRQFEKGGRVFQRLILSRPFLRSSLALEEHKSGTTNGPF